MKTILISAFLLLFISSCTSNGAFENGKKQLQMQGYSNIENTGYSWFCCSKDDDFSTGFEAIDKNGNKVTGCFCSGVLKGVTIRFN